MKHLPCSTPLASFRPASSQSHLFGATESAQAVAAQPLVRAEGAGLVLYKTKNNSTKTVCENDEFSVALDRFSCADRRVNHLKRSVWASGHLHSIAENGFRPAVPWFVTLTYAKADDWKPNHLTAAAKGFREWCKSRAVPCRYTWVAEIQPQRLMKTGEAAVHYHLLAWLPVGVRMPCWDRRTVTKRGFKRAPFWCHGMTQRAEAKSGVGYLMKYLSKLGEFTIFPKGLRLYGIGGLNVLGRSVRQWFNLPQWAKNGFGVGELKRVAGRLVVQATGEILEPAYSVRIVPGSLILRALRDVLPRWADGAYSSVSFI